MNSILQLVGMALILAGEGPNDSSRRPNPLAPSLPLLTESEEQQLDGMIDHFIEYDTGRLSGDKGKAAVAEFRNLGPEAIPALIRGLNRAAKIEGSCPAVTIAKKLKVLFSASSDRELLQFARENIGLGITQSRHMNVLKDLRFYCLMRMRTAPQQSPTFRPIQPPDANTFRSISASQLLVEAAGAKSGARRNQLLKELERRTDEEFIGDVAEAAVNAEDEDVRNFARKVLSQRLDNKSPSFLKKMLKKNYPEMQMEAIHVIARKDLHLESDLIDLLRDSHSDVAQAARRALIQLSHGLDFGPKENAGGAESLSAVQKWRAWLAK